MARTIHILSPVGESSVKALHVLPLPDLAGKTVGFIDNRKTNFDVLVHQLAETLRDRHGVAHVIHRQKVHAAVPATPELLAEMARACDVVITGSGD